MLYIMPYGLTILLITIIFYIIWKQCYYLFPSKFIGDRLDNMITKIELISSFYLTKHEDRTNELLKCLDNNMDGKYINHFHLFVDDKNDVDFLKKRYKDRFNDHITICGMGQPLYSDLFMYCDTLKGKICMIQNSDIWIYDITDIHIFDKLKENNKKNCFCLLLDTIEKTILVNRDCSIQVELILLYSLPL